MPNKISHRFINPNGRDVDQVPVHVDAIGAFVVHDGPNAQPIGVTLTLNTDDGRTLRLMLDDATLERMIAVRAEAGRRLGVSGA